MQSSSKQEPTSPYVRFLELPHQLEVIDQRKLPLAEAKVKLRTVDDVKQAIEHMIVRGAPLIGICGAFGMALAGEVNDDLDSVKRSLDAIRPTAVNLSYCTSRMLAFARRTQDRTTMFEEVKSIAFEEFNACEKMADYGSRLIPQQPREGQSSVSVIHHCNTGGLATFGAGTALGCIVKRAKAAANVFVWVDETRPRLQGAKLTAWELNRAKVPNRVIADGAAGSLLATGRVDCVLFGADRIVANGDVVNKVGTYPLSVVAKENGVPVYCVAPTSSIDLTLSTGAAVKIEERSESELFEFDGKRFVDETAKGYNPAFDVTPFKYITAIVTEEMVCYPPFRGSLAVAKAQALAKQQGITLQTSDEPVAVEKAQEILGKVQQKRTSAERLFPAQNDPVEEKKVYRREDPRSQKPKTFLGDGSDQPRLESVKDEPRFPMNKSSILSEANATSVLPPIANVKQFDARKSNLVLGDDAEAPPKATKSSVKVLVPNKNKSAGIFGDDDVSVMKSKTREAPASPSNPDEGKGGDQDVERHSTAKGHFQPPKHDGDDKPVSRGHFAAPSPEEQHPKSKGHMTPPHPLDSNVFG